MEVHAHTHPSTSSGTRKKWTHYFWEFLMLFLAVFCGFLAENQREHMIEHRREKQYVRSLYNDLKKDTAFYRRINLYLVRSYMRLDSLIDLINTGKYINEPEAFYRLSLATRFMVYFEYNNSTFEQLKNSGNLRLLRKNGISDSITEYNNLIERRVENQESRYMLSTSNINNAFWEILDTRYYKMQQLIEGNPIPERPMIQNPLINKVDEQKLLKLKNLLFERMLIIGPYKNFVELLLWKRAENLLLLIKEKYHFE
jgi:hypothetical protein